MVNLCSSQTARIASWILRWTGALLGQEDVLGELLRQRRAALHRAWCSTTFEKIARPMPIGIDAEMRVEAPVLDRDEGLRQVARQLLDPDCRAAGVAAVCDQRCRRRREWRCWAGAAVPRSGRSAAAWRPRRRSRRRRRCLPRCRASSPLRTSNRRRSVRPRRRLRLGAAFRRASRGGSRRVASRARRRGARRAPPRRSRDRSSARAAPTRRPSSCRAPAFRVTLGAAL